MHPKKEKIQNI